MWGTRIWDQFSACSVSTAVKELRTALKSETKDIAFVCGGPVWVTGLDGTVKKSGHAVTIVLTKDKYGNRVLIQKDPLPKDEVTARAKCYDIASGLGIRTIQVIPMQLDESTSECLLESYRFLAKVLDGKFIRGYENFEKRIYSVSERKPLSDKFIIG